MPLRSRLIGGAIAAGVGLAAASILAPLIGSLPASTWAVAPIGLAIGGILGFWLSPALIQAGGVRTVAVGLAAGLLPMPLVGFLGSIPPVIDALLAGNLVALVAPLGAALFMAVIGVGALVVSIPAGLTWAAVTRRSIGNRPPSAMGRPDTQPTGDLVVELRRRSRRNAILAAGLVILLWAAALRLSPLWPGPALPAGATRLHIATGPVHLLPTLGCPAALLAPVRIATADDELVALNVETGEAVQVVWPSGWAAWQVEGRAELLARDGSLVAREGDVLDDLGGGTGDDGAFNVCLIGS